LVVVNYADDSVVQEKRWAQKIQFAAVVFFTLAGREPVERPPAAAAA